MVVEIRATAATTLLKAGIPDKMALQRTGHRTLLESLREYQSLDINDTKRVSGALSSTRADNTEICEKQQICVANSNNIEDISLVEEPSGLNNDAAEAGLDRLI